MGSWCLYIISAAILLLFVTYKYLTRNNGYWTSQGIPEAKGEVLLFGHVLDQILMRKNMGMLTASFYNGHPHASMVGIYVTQTPVLIVRHPELVKFVLSSGFAYFSRNTTVDEKIDPLLFHDPFVQSGQKWKDSRGIFVSAFSLKKMKERMSSISDTCEKMANYLKQKTAVDGFIDLEAKDLFSKYTLGVSASGILGIDEPAFVDKVKENSLRHMMNSIFEVTSNNAIKQNILLALPAFARLFSTSYIPPWVNTGFSKLVDDIQLMKANDKIPRVDILHHIADCLREKGHDPKELAPHAFGFFVEQYETSSIALGLMSYFIAKDTRVQDKMRKEVEEVLKKHEDIYSYDALNDMTYIEQVAKEAMRLLTPLGRLVRLCSKPVTLEGPDGLTCTLKPGDEVHIPLSGLHMDPEYWENPKEFIPERFDKENEEQRHNFLFLPFGGGARLCPGMKLGIMQIKAAMATVLMNYVIEISEKMKEPVKQDTRYFLVAIDGGIWVRLRQRISFY